ncbi:FN3KRP [Bugula neritina]|uniref:protein-ribulosamine 3-kinase n=1 Tax=Bugula neritina TaxID=10212 RepID=A0A7J7K926_BUGNE|nr:FN3KRP [Bugula neritina]
MADTNTIHCPRPIKVLENIPGGGCAIIMEYLDLGSSGDETALGTGLARLHMHNWQSLEKGEGVANFGFPVATSCGSIPQDNSWTNDWMEFFCKKIDSQLDRLGSGSSSKEAKSLWSQLRPNIHKLFDGLVIRPSLLHGDLWGGNIGYTSRGPVIYDPASFYGHYEYDFGINQCFPSFGRRFYEAYHSLIPKEPGCELRLQLYKLFHLLNHWNLFGSGYSSSSIKTLKDILRKI